MNQETRTWEPKNLSKTKSPEYLALNLSFELRFTNVNASSRNLNLFKIISSAIATSGDKSLTTGKDQIISCTISSLGAAATVKWIGPDNNDVPTNDYSKYIIDEGNTGYGRGSQTTQVIIKAAKMVEAVAPETYKCSVTSSLYATSPASETSITITPIGTSSL